MGLWKRGCLCIMNACQGFEPGYVSTDFWVGNVGGNQAELVASIQNPKARNKAAIKINMEFC